MADQPGPEMRTIAVRANHDLRGRLDSILKITGMSVNDAVTEAIEAWVAGKLADPTVRDKALESLEAEERALQERRRTLQGLVGGDSPPTRPTESEPTPRPTRRSKAANE